MRVILIQSDVKGIDVFLSILKNRLSDFYIATSLDQVHASDIEVVIIWRQAPGFLHALPNLRLVLSCGSGIDQFPDLGAFPRTVPMVRLVDPYLRCRVSDYVVGNIPERYFPHTDIASDREMVSRKHPITVGVMGLGLIGSAIADRLSVLGFHVVGWVRTHKPRILKDVYVGRQGLTDFARHSDIVVCQLPLTSDTEGILDHELFASMPTGSYLINVGRGAHLVEADLLGALEKGYLSGACLDVFIQEPLPEQHPFQYHPAIKVTPHIAGYVGPETQAPHACEVIEAFYTHGQLTGVVDYDAKY